MAKKFNEVVNSLRKNITREYKAKLTKDQRKVFRSQMWAFRRDPESLSAEEKQALEALFEKIPALRPLYKVHFRLKEILDQPRPNHGRWLRELRRECGQLGLDLGSFWRHPTVGRRRSSTTLMPPRPVPRWKGSTTRPG